MMSLKKFFASAAMAALLFVCGAALAQTPPGSAESEASGAQQSAVPANRSEETAHEGAPPSSKLGDCTLVCQQEAEASQRQCKQCLDNATQLQSNLAPRVEGKSTSPWYREVCKQTCRSTADPQECYDCWEWAKGLQ